MDVLSKKNVKKNANFFSSIFSALFSNQESEESENMIELSIIPTPEQRLHLLGIEEVNLRGVSEAKKLEVTDAFEEMYSKYPELKGKIQKVTVDKLPGNVLASAAPYFKNNKLIMGQIILSESYYKSAKLNDTLRNDKEKGFLAGEGIKGNVMHEIGHILQLNMDTLSSGAHMGEEITKEKWDIIKTFWAKDINTRWICESAMAKLGLSEKDISKELSTYGSTNYGECFAEAISEVESSKNPRRLSVAIVNEYKNYMRTRKF